MQSPLSDPVILLLVSRGVASLLLVSLLPLLFPSPLWSETSLKSSSSEKSSKRDDEGIPSVSLCSLWVWSNIGGTSGSVGMGVVSLTSMGGSFCSGSWEVGREGDVVEEGGGVRFVGGAVRGSGAGQVSSHF